MATSGSGFGHQQDLGGHRRCWRGRMTGAAQRWLRPGLMALLAWMLTWAPAQAHTLITVTADLVADGDALTVTLTVSPQDLIACLSPKGEATYALLTGLDGRLGTYLAEHVRLSIDGIPQTGRFGGYLPVLLNPRSPPAATSVLPDKLPFVLMWSLPPTAQHLTLSLTLFLDEGLPGICTLGLEPGATGKRQVAYVELGKPWTFTLHPAAVPLAQTDTAVAPVSTVTSTAATATIQWSAAQAVILGMRHACIDAPPFLLLAVIIAVRACEWPLLLGSLASFALAQAITIAAVSAGLLVPGRVPIALLGCGAIVLAAFSNIRPRQVVAWRLATTALAGAVAAAGVTLDAGRTLGSGAIPVGTAVLVTLGIVCVEVASMVLAIALTAGAWDRPWYQRAVVVPLSLAIAVGGAIWIAERAWTLPV
jgi:hypothetical protein